MDKSVPSKTMILGDFKITGKLGEGGMGIVYRARQLSLDRDVALKILPPKLAADEDFVARFHREARAAARLNHPNIIQIYAAGVDHGFHYMAMELIDGATTRELIDRNGPLSERAAIRLVLEICSALEHAHRDGVVHRDIKPDNIMVTKEGVAKLADLGLAKQTLSAETTHAGALVGTPRYMSPEQASRAEAIDGRADLYSLGATVYHLVSGKPPFQGDNAMQVIMKHLHERPEPLRSRSPHISEEFCRIVDRLLEKDPRGRYPSARDLMNDLARLDRPEQVRPPRDAGAPPTGPFAPATRSLRADELPPLQDTPPPPLSAQTAPLQLTQDSFAFLGGVAPASPASPPPFKQSVRPSAPAPVQADRRDASPSGRPPLTPPRLPEVPFEPTFRTSSQLTPEQIQGLVMLGILLTCGVVAFFVFRPSKTVKPPPPVAAVKPERTPEQIAAAEKWYEVRARVERFPRDYVANLDALRKVDPKPLSDSDQQSLKAFIAQQEKDVREEGEDRIRAIRDTVSKSLEHRRFTQAEASLQRFPESLATAEIQAEIAGLREQVRTEASRMADTMLAEARQAMKRGDYADVVTVRDSLPAEELVPFAPEPVREVQRLAEEARSAIRRAEGNTARQAVKQAIEEIQTSFDHARWFEALGAAERLSQDSIWTQSLSILPSSKRLISDLTSLSRLRQRVVEGLERNVGKDLRIRGKMRILAIKSGRVDMDHIGIREHKDAPISDVFRVNDISRIVTENTEAKEDQELRWQLALVYLFLGDPVNAEECLRGLPDEQCLPYQEELTFHRNLALLQQEMAPIPAVSFPLGTPREEIARLLETMASAPKESKIESQWIEAETSPGQVTVGPLYLARCEVTHRQYARFLDERRKTKDHVTCSPDEPKSKDHTPRGWEDAFATERADYPVVGVDWYDAYAYASWARRRLPTEAEWECAASWGPSIQEKRSFPWGGKWTGKPPLPRLANLSSIAPGQKDDPSSLDFRILPAKADSGRPGESAWGCRNLAGNVWEWVGDWFAPYPTEPGAKPPQSPPPAKTRVVRGGSFRSAAFFGRCTARYAFSPETRRDDLGFRCAADTPDLMQVRLRRYADDGSK